MLTVHHLEESRSIRIVWLLEELDVDAYEIEHYERDPETRLAPPELRDVHPLGRSPVITDEGRTVAESGAIVEYLLDRFGEGDLRPEGDLDAVQPYRYWMHYAEGSAMPDLVLRLVFGELPEQAPWPASTLLGFVSDAVDDEFIRPRIERHLDLWEETLAERDYFAADTFTAADLQMSVSVGFALADVSEDRCPEARGWLDRIRRRPAFEAAADLIGEPNPIVPEA
jgi:glutathione S-transferase